MSERMNVDDVRLYALNAYRHAANHSKRCHDELIRYYAEGSKSPSIAHMIYRDEFKKSTKRGILNSLNKGQSLSAAKKSVYETSRFLNEADRSDKVKPFYLDFKESWEKKYPNTESKRRFIVENDFVVWDKVTKKTFFGKYWKRFLYSRFLKTL